MHLKTDEVLNMIVNHEIGTNIKYLLLQLAEQRLKS